MFTVRNLLFFIDSYLNVNKHFYHGDSGLRQTLGKQEGDHACQDSSCLTLLSS